MAYIYKITNIINNKIYIGKTEKENPFDRWYEHKSNIYRESCRDRPLYRAMTKYGIDNFVFEIIEETNNACEREVYWINFYNSYKEGYNATLGGDGKSYIDIDLIIKLYNDGYSCRKISLELGHDAGYISKLLTKNNIIVDSYRPIKNKTLQYSKDNELLNTFDSRTSAAQYCLDNNLTNCKLSTARTHICEVCSGKRKTFAKFIWKDE